MRGESATEIEMRWRARGAQPDHSDKMKTFRETEHLFLAELQILESRGRPCFQILILLQQNESQDED